jgi:hypothetical protein
LIRQTKPPPGGKAGTAAVIQPTPQDKGATECVARYWGSIKGLPMDSVPPDLPDEEDPLVANDDMERIRDAVLAELGGWNHHDWVGRYDNTCPDSDPKHKQNRGLIGFCAAFGLEHPYEPSPASEAAARWASHGENEDSELWHEIRNDTERFVGIPHYALFDHAGLHEFTLYGRRIVVAFPYLMALNKYVSNLPALVQNLRKRGMQVRCIANGWWNAWTVGLVYMQAAADSKRASQALWRRTQVPPKPIVRRRCHISRL